MDVFDLFAKISLDTSGYDNNLKSASANFSKFGKAVTTGVKTAIKVGTAAIAGIGTASTIAGKKVVDLAGKTAEYGDNIDKMSQKMGISAKAYQEWDAIMQHSGTSIDALKPSMKTLANQAQKGAEEFQKLGISQKEVASLSQEDLFAKVIAGLQDMEEGTERTAITSKLLGRGATELGALLNTSSKDTEEMRKRVHELGGVMSDEAVKAAAKYQDTLQDMQTAFKNTSRTLGSEFMPSITTVMEGLTNIFAGEDGGGKKIQEGINGIFESISSAIPKLAEVGKGIVNGIGTAIFDNLPALIDFGASVIDNIASGIISAIPKLADGAVQILNTIDAGLSGSGSMMAQTANQIITNLANGLTKVLPKLLTTGLNIIKEIATGISQALPTLVPEAVKIVVELAKTIVSELPSMLQAGIDLIKGLLDGIKTAIPTLLDEAPVIVGDLAQALIDCASMIMDAGADLLSSLVEDLPTIIDNIVEAIPKIIDKLVSVLTGSENTGKISKSGENLLGSLVKNLPKIITTIVTAMPKIIVSIVSAVIKAIPQIAKAGFEFLIGLVKRIPDAGKYVVDKVGGFMSDLLDKIKEFDLIEFGKNLIEGLWKGISSMAGWIGDKVTGFFDGIVDGIAGVLGIHSPSTVLAGMGKNSALGYGLGWDKTFPKIRSGIEKSINFDTWSPTVSTASRASGNYELLGLMRKISNQLDMINTDMVQTIESTDTTIVLNDREFGRAVRKAYA